MTTSTGSCSTGNRISKESFEEFKKQFIGK